jgi:peptide deformylase
MNKDKEINIEKLNEEIKIVPSSEIEGVICEEVKETEKLEEAISIGEKLIAKCISLGGVGLAAPQIGINKRIFVWMFKPEIFQIAINPTFYKEGHKKISMIEMCLSYPGERYYISGRWKSIRAVYYSINKSENKLVKITKSISGESAIIYQHEIWHLDGKTIATEGKLIKDA